MKAAAIERGGIWSMFGTHVAMGRGHGTDAVSLSGRQSDMGGMEKADC